MIEDLVPVYMIVSLGGDVNLLALIILCSQIYIERGKKEPTLLFEKSRGCRPRGVVYLSWREGSVIGTQ